MKVVDVVQNHCGLSKFGSSKLCTTDSLLSLRQQPRDKNGHFWARIYASYRLLLRISPDLFFSVAVKWGRGAPIGLPGTV